MIHWPPRYQRLRYITIVPQKLTIKPINKRADDDIVRLKRADDDIVRLFLYFSSYSRTVAKNINGVVSIIYRLPQPQPASVSCIASKHICTKAMTHMIIIV